ncbi:cell wall-binding repeat-containing protein [Euzebya rosea]|uniref:cell wall-binding repeat-containing protein n=1 Tax=Euzebya rosea TaxID=2052804 RepID=UPI000D3E374B|nr:cell wall-binding repeat-containing protein [Euzebya rosea]
MQGNLTGTTADGASALGNRGGINSGEGIYVLGSASGALIGGTDPAAGNTIADNGNHGIFVQGPDALVQNNRIDTNAAGTAALGNTNDGIASWSSATGLRVGTPGAGNLLSGNGRFGVYALTEGMTVEGNLIGTDAAGTGTVPNDDGGVVVQQVDVRVGGADAGAGNTIAGNDDFGLLVVAGASAAVSRNTIHDNGALGIDLGKSFLADGVTPNDTGDGDVGPSGFQNFPVLNTPTAGRALRGSLDSTPDTDFVIEVFASDECDPSGYGEGERFLGAVDARTDATGTTTFFVGVPLAVGEVVTATATGPEGTSEFSPCREVRAPSPTPTIDPADVSAASSADDPIQAAIDLSNLRFTEPTAFAQDTRTVPFAVLARADVFADALGGSVLTGDAPLLYTAGDTLDPRTATELDRILDDGTVYLLGGTAALSDDVERAITDAGHTPVRLAGPSRVETALAVADLALTLTPDPDGVMLARADGPADNPTAAWADAITAGGLAADIGQPILLTPTDTLHPAVADWLDGQDLPVTALGGPAAISDDVVDRISATRANGTTRYGTAVTVADLWPATSGGYVIANGTADDAWAFTLAAAGAAADLDQPTLLVDSDRLPDETDDRLCATGTRADTTLIGSDRLIDQAVRDALTQPC